MSANPVPRRRALILGLAAFYLLAHVALGIRMCGWTQLAVLAGTLGGVGALLSGLVVLGLDWRRAHWRAAIPLLACLAAAAAASPLAFATRELVFALELPAYESIVARLDVHDLRPGSSVSPLPLSDAEQRHVGYARAQRTQDGTLYVELLNGSAFPVKHAGYVYTSSGKIAEDAHVWESWPVKIAVRDHWVRVRD